MATSDTYVGDRRAGAEGLDVGRAFLTRTRGRSVGAIRQSAIDLYPDASGATRNRQVITPTLAVINHCADLELCAPIRIRRFDFTKKIKTPVDLEWMDTFCAHARPLNIALALTMYATACRICEARRIQWPDIDFKRQRNRIHDTKTNEERFANMPQRLLVALANLAR